jgi:hypothetical protein
MSKLTIGRQQHRPCFLVTFLNVSVPRRALCQLAIARPQKAVTDLKKVLSIDPQNKLARQQLDATQKLIRKAEFEKVVSTSVDVLTPYLIDYTFFRPLK